MNLSGKTIVVTGAASGIGAETARVLTAAGARVIGLDRHEATENIDQFISLDLSDPVSISQAADALPDGIDALCNVAGLPPTAGVVPVMKVNVLGLQALTERVLQKMSEGGSIVNVASLAGSGWPGHILLHPAADLEGQASPGRRAAVHRSRPPGGFGPAVLRTSFRPGGGSGDRRCLCLRGVRR